MQIYVHNDLNSLYEYVPKEMLPEEYGGAAGPIAEINREYLFFLLLVCFQKCYLLVNHVIFLI